MVVKYTNRNKEVQTFEINERGNIQWNADFEHSRMRVEYGGEKAGEEFREGYVDNGYPGDIPVTSMVDPAGGPYIPLGYDMGAFDKSFYGMIVRAFISNDDGYEIIIYKKAKPSPRSQMDLLSDQVQNLTRMAGNTIDQIKRLQEIITQSKDEKIKTR